MPKLNESPSNNDDKPSQREIFERTSFQLDGLAKMALTQFIDRLPLDESQRKRFHENFDSLGPKMWSEAIIKEIKENLLKGEFTLAELSSCVVFISQLEELRKWTPNQSQDTSEDYLSMFSPEERAVLAKNIEACLFTTIEEEGFFPNLSEILLILKFTEKILGNAEQTNGALGSFDAENLLKLVLEKGAHESNLHEPNAPWNAADRRLNDFSALVESIFSIGEMYADASWRAEKARLQAQEDLAKEQLETASPKDHEALFEAYTAAIQRSNTHRWKVFGDQANLLEDSHVMGDYQRLIKGLWIGFEEEKGLPPAFPNYGPPNLDALDTSE